MSIFDPDRIRSIHLELTTRCNARCPMCARTANGTTREGLAMTELSIEDIRAIFPAATLEAIETIDLCGAFGDPLVARDLDAILVHLRTNPALAVDIYTNGSLRPNSWWTALPTKLGPLGKVCFGIDGLADTNGFHRVGTDFATIMRNAAAFIGGGGRAQWDFLVFRHNQHQIDAARRLSKTMGFAAFSVKVSGRFHRRFDEETPEPKIDMAAGHGRFPVLGRDGRHSHDLEPPDDPSHRNASHARTLELVAAEGSLAPTLDRNRISCLSIERGGVFVGADGTVFPCCWTYMASKNGPVFGMTKPENLRIAHLLAAHGGTDAIDARRHALRDIVAGPFFEALGESWRAPTVDQGKPKVCARICGGGFSPRDSYAEPRLSPYGQRPTPPTVALG